MSIWKYSSSFTPVISSSCQLSLGEGNTPLLFLSDMASVEGQKNLYAKLEYKNPTGSHKARAMAYQLSLAKQQGIKKVAISSTGNAAIAAAAYAKLAQIECTVFVSPTTSPHKLSLLKDSGCILTISERPLQELRLFCLQKNALNLNATQSDHAIEAYQTIAFELIKQLDRIDTIFVYCSSAATYLGIVKGFTEKKKQGSIHSLPQAHCCYLRETILPGVFKSQVYPGIISKQPAILARKEQLEKAISHTKGNNFEVTDQDMLLGRDLLKKSDLDSSPEGCALIGLQQRIDPQYKNGNTVILLTGTGEQWATQHES